MTIFLDDTPGVRQPGPAGPGSPGGSVGSAFWGKSFIDVKINFEYGFSPYIYPIADSYQINIGSNNVAISLTSRLTPWRRGVGRFIKNDSFFCIRDHKSILIYIKICGKILRFM